MNLQELIVTAQRFAIVNPPFPVKVIVQGDSSALRPTMAVRINWTVPCRETGRPIKLSRINYLTRWDKEFMTEDRLFRMMQKWVREVFLHEADECIQVDGIRRFDPHADEVNPPSPPPAPSDPGQPSDYSASQLLRPEQSKH